MGEIQKPSISTIIIIIWHCLLGGREREKEEFPTPIQQPVKCTSLFEVSTMPHIVEDDDGDAYPLDG